MSVRIITGDCREVLDTLPENSIHCVITSPPYWQLRDYGVVGQIGREPDLKEFIDEMTNVFRKVRRVLRSDGTLWLNLSDSYANDSKWGGYSGGKHAAGLHGYSGIGRSRRNTGLKSKELCGIPWRTAFALQSDGWYLRQDIIWSKPNPMPESVKDRCTRAHEYLFLFSKNKKYYYNIDAISEPASDTGRPNFDGVRHTIKLVPGGGPQNRRCGTKNGVRNKRSVWTIPTRPFPEAHFATFPIKLVDPCIRAGCPVNGTVCDPFSGAGTVGVVADQLNRNAILIELNPEYVAISDRRINGKKEQTK